RFYYLCPWLFRKTPQLFYNSHRSNTLCLSCCRFLPSRNNPLRPGINGQLSHTPPRQKFLTRLISKARRSLSRKMPALTNCCLFFSAQLILYARTPQNHNDPTPSSSYRSAILNGLRCHNHLPATAGPSPLHNRPCNCGNFLNYSSCKQFHFLRSLHCIYLLYPCRS